METHKTHSNKQNSKSSDYITVAAAAEAEANTINIKNDAKQRKQSVKLKTMKQVTASRK